MPAAPPISVEIEATIVNDKTEFFAQGGEPFYPVGGGTIPAPEGGLTIRHIMLKPDDANPPDGEFAADRWIIPSGIILVGATQSNMVVGRKLRITFEEIIPE